MSDTYNALSHRAMKRPAPVCHRTSTMTKAELAVRLARIARTAVNANLALADGMWNPQFCADTDMFFGRSILEDLETQIKNLKKRMGK